ncbi:hypothetical protein [Candidatus Mycobacterium methanotrophicum]|uniref:Uncharacterized protein n=1 Tax=Candidatus Mycobacterium methanotrophicum TaxID=2943498 RepID=A0ABY4QR03_9MYCO|nr:hypothetical protein [Candidatus Mycobacterium methanotrophicum]UQX12025.1 hypothetical protein M5I08_06680 [Candidatus Mycobacterium methanotrophicum]
MVAIFVPLTALLAILIVAWPAARRRVGGASLFVAAGTLVAIPLTTAAGNWLRQRVMGGEALSRHAALGGQLVLWSALLTIAMVVWWVLHTPLFANEVATLSPLAQRSRRRRSGHIVVRTYSDMVHNASWSHRHRGRVGWHDLLQMTAAPLAIDAAPIYYLCT